MWVVSGEGNDCVRGTVEYTEFSMNILAAVLKGEGAASREGVLKDTCADIKRALHTEGDKRTRCVSSVLYQKGTLSARQGEQNMKTL
jgi:hypothetical protein